MPTLSWYHSEEVSWRTPSREATGQETNLIPLGILWRTDLFQLSWFWGQVVLSLRCTCHHLYSSLIRHQWTFWPKDKVSPTGPRCQVQSKVQKEIFQDKPTPRTALGSIRPTWSSFSFHLINWSFGQGHLNMLDIGLAISIVVLQSFQNAEKYS